MQDQFKSILLVGLQFLCIIVLLSTSTLKHISLTSYILLGLSVLVMLWAIATMQKSKLRVQPQPARNAVFITSGPYRFVRHPMYTAVLLGCVGLLTDQFTWLRFSIVLALAIVLIIKLRWEEKMLMQKFEQYEQYCEHTHRLIPFVY